MRWGFDVSFVVASSPVGRPSAAQSSRSISEQGRTALLRLQQAVAGIPVHSSASSAAAVGNGRHHLGLDDRFGLALSTHPPHAPCPCHAMPNRTLPASPANPPCQSTRQANSLHTQHARRLPSFHLSLCFAHPLSPQRRFDLALFFLFFSYPSHHSHPACSSAFFLFAPVLLAISKSILSRAFCRRSIALAVGPCLQSSSTLSTTPLPRLDPPDPRASSTPPDENTRRVCCLLFPRVSFVLSPWHWTAGVFRAFGALRGTEPMQTSTRTSSRRRPGPGREPGRGPGYGLGLGLEDMGWIM